MELAVPYPTVKCDQHMIERNEIDNMAGTLGVHTSHVQRDYVHGWLLSFLYSTSDLSEKLALKGGNCLRKGYFESSRYSRDLDFTTAADISDENLGLELNSICEAVSDKCDITFDLSKTRIQDKKRVDSDKHITEARLYFKDFYGEESELLLSVRFDLTQFDRIYLPIQERRLIHPYSDRDECSTPIRCVKLEELLATKIRCLLQRKHIADFFDLVYSTMINKELDIDRDELLSTFFKITIFSRHPSVAKGLLIDLPMEGMSNLWSKYISCPNSSWFDFEKAKDSFLKLIHLLIPEDAEREFSSIIFPSSLRNPILLAADNLTMLKMTYHNKERLIEPYELAFKVRRDGVAREYFYAYDTVGGYSSEPGLKTFTSNKIQRLENTTLPFEPRYHVDVNSSTGSEKVSRFKRRRGPRRSHLGTNWNPSRASFVRRSGSSNYWGMTYWVRCPFCNKKFKRRSLDTKLNPHKDKYGNHCHGRIGHIV